MRIQIGIYIIYTTYSIGINARFTGKIGINEKRRKV